MSKYVSISIDEMPPVEVLGFGSGLLGKLNYELADCVDTSRLFDRVFPVSCTIDNRTTYSFYAALFKDPDLTLLSAKRICLVPVSDIKERF